MEHTTFPEPGQLSPESDRSHSAKTPKRRFRRLSKRATGRALGASLIVLIVAAQLWLWRSMTQLRSRLDNVAFQAELERDDGVDDMISPSVGVIQFLHSGFSITIDSLSYSPAGVNLVGEFGNPKMLQLSSVTLGFTAHSPRMMRRAVWDRNPLDFWLGGDIGSAEVAIGNVPYGRQTPFRVTIPNVRQVKDSSYVISVRLKGERYGYPLQ